MNNYRSEGEEVKREERKTRITENLGGKLNKDGEEMRREAGERRGIVR